MARPIPPLANLLDVTQVGKIGELFGSLKLATAKEGFKYRIHDGTEAGGRVRYRCDRAGAPKTKTTGTGKGQRNRKSKRCQCKHAVSLVQVLGTTAWKFRIDNDSHNHLTDGTPIASLTTDQPSTLDTGPSDNGEDPSILYQPPQSTTDPVLSPSAAVELQGSPGHSPQHGAIHQSPLARYPSLESVPDTTADNEASTSTAAAVIPSTSPLPTRTRELAFGGERIQGAGPWSDFAIVRDILAADNGTKWEPYPWPLFDPSESEDDTHSRFVSGIPLICHGRNEALGASYPEEITTQLLDLPNEEITVLDGASRRYELDSLHDCVKRFLALDPRDTPFGVLDYQINDTALSNLIVPPAFCRSLDWTSRSWAQAEVIKMGRAGWRVNDMRSVQFTTPGLYTDFHVDSGNSSSWFHVAKGHKCLIVALPTEENRAAFQTWDIGGRKEWLGDVVDHLYKIDVRSGDTVIWEGGLIHAVITYEASIVFTGSFVHEYNLRDLTEGWWISLGDEAWQIPLFPRLCVLYAKHLLKTPQNQLRLSPGVDSLALSGFLERLGASGKTCDKHVGKGRRREVGALGRRLRAAVEKAEGSVTGV